ncbi:Myb/SANT-like transcription factor [Oryctes borbonicus]|uniref:Myb/SANT-like transcription factor n=1 Tax=Oryctes borbonicus TaxID=1629725 RepID=A0A0T6BAH6_9SCAR|nr:Myb/SANT-like transcription factor [Oryctes borbonicus]
MDNEQCKTLIAAYRDHRSLWDPKQKKYHSNTAREDAWKEISTKLNIPAAELRTKMRSLLGTYRREKSRTKKTLVTASGRKSVYVSKWFAFKSFDFLSNRDVPSQTMDTLSDAERINTPEQNIENTQFAEVLEQVQPSSSTNTMTVQPSPTIIRRKRIATSTSEGDPVIEKPFSNLHKSSDVTIDPYFSFGQYVANELRKYDSATLAYVKRAINNIIFDADMGRYGCLEQEQQSTPSTSSTVTHTAPENESYIAKYETDTVVMPF